MITKEQVNEAKENYFNLLEQYHKENNTIIRLKRAQDGYQGDYCCLDFVDKVECKYISGEGSPNILECNKNGIRIGILKQWYGNNGLGKLANEVFYPEKGIKVEWQ